MRFQTKILFGEKTVSRGFGKNKKESKIAASKILLEMLCPKIYKQWAQKYNIADPL
jgi:dsRNA-specific ribonuclease